MRRYAPLRSRLDRPALEERRAFREAVLARDRSCVGRIVGFPTRCSGPLEADHIRASGALGRKSESDPRNGAALCGACHRWKTEHGREARPLLLGYVERVAS